LKNKALSVTLPKKRTRRYDKKTNKLAEKMGKTRRKFTDEFKTKVVLVALQERSTLSE